jgi:hypothetical protein
MRKVTTKSSDISTQLELFDFPDIKKPVEVSFTAPDMSSFGGLHLLHGVNLRQGFLARLASHIVEWRNKDLIVHGLDEMLTQRVFQIIAGYEDADDCDALRHDSMLKMCSGLLPKDGDLCSQPTMTRLENHVSHRELYNMGKEFVDQFIRSYKKVPAKIILDFDDSNSNTYGAQQLSLFNDYYGEHCYMPLFVFEGYSGKLVLPLLRPGRVNKRVNVFGLMKRVIAEIRRHWGETVIIVRGDSMFCSHEFMEWAQQQYHVEYVTGLTGNKRLSGKSAPWVARAREMFAKDGKDVKLYFRHYYKADVWKRPQLVVTKVECNKEGTNVRHVVTSVYGKSPKEVYERLYCKRGDCELYIKELKNGLWADRMSCSRFSANQFRLFLHAAAYVLMLEAKQILFRGSDLSHVTVSTFREKVILSAVRVKEQGKKVKVEFARDHPIRAMMRLALRRAASQAPTFSGRRLPAQGTSSSSFFRVAGLYS